MGLFANGERVPLLASPGYRRNNISALTLEKARLIDELHNNGPVLPCQRITRAIICDRLSAYADFVADPLLDYIRLLPQAERAKVNRYLRADREPQFAWIRQCSGADVSTLTPEAICYRKRAGPR
eukprot:9245932-Pyramimonas_sp.AAC.1